MTFFNERIAHAVALRELPGIVLLARDKEDNFSYTSCHGTTSLAPGPQPLMTPDTTLRLASATKLVTTIACLQAVEHGVLTLDGDIAPLLPELAAQQVLGGFTWYGRPQLADRKKKLTLRHLLSHTAGTGYDFLAIHSQLGKWRWWKGEKVGGDGQDAQIENKYAYPLLHEPGEGWTYGSGVSWAGRALERASGMSLGGWVQRYINEPLGLERGVMFFPRAKDQGDTTGEKEKGRNQYGSVGARLKKKKKKKPSYAVMALRNAWTGRMDNNAAFEATTLAKEMSAGPGSPCLGGEGAHGSAADFVAIMQSLLKDDGKLVKPETSELMFTPQLRVPGGDPRQRMDLHACLSLPGSWICGAVLVKGEFDWGLGGALVDGGSHEWLGKGTMTWSGVIHIFWWIDREKGVCGMFGSQVMPAADPTTIRWINEFQGEVYRLLRLRRTMGA